ncbi:MAG: FtsH protease activity modulator HflK [Desulfotignum sp.]|nr:FtsH protease activity modulator HflK [Desulfotignum sp.]MCF8113867.1 FtsH protease activity modulator HflK [Desulfotignum sp.]MCF8126267.1 FtsH protease activity modulator HflK [Desulfotignum sp.]
MNWDWEKLRENQQKYEQNKGGSGGPGMPRPPQMDEILNKFKGFKFPGIFLVIIVLLVLYLGSSIFFTVDRSEVGVIQRFGKFSRLAQPGLNFKLPSGIEKVTKVNVRTPETEEFGVSAVQTTGYGSASESSLMLTGDLNVAVVPWIVQYRRADPRAYLFNVKDVTSLLRNMSEATMRTVVGDRSINEVITKRAEIAMAARESLQKELDNARAGIAIVNIEMKKTNVPEPVQASFNQVNQAIQEKEQTIYKAREEYNKAVPLARGEAQRVIKDAEGYAIDRVNRAQGDAAKFLAVYEAYDLARDVTRKRMYLETMQEVLPKIGAKYIIDADQKNMLPLLNMGEGASALQDRFLQKGE